MQPTAVRLLRNIGYDVYDFRNPTPGDNGFSWSDISPIWKTWTPQEFCSALCHPIATRGFCYDWSAVQNADVGVLLLPCGHSAHLEAGYFVGAGKPLFILLDGQRGEPELMYKMATQVCLSFNELLAALESEVAK
jgi:hypothetical protein